jgi:hypothetical protein
MAKKPTPFVDPTLPKVPVEVSGKTYSLCFDFNALATAEAITGVNLLKAMDFQNLSAVSFRALLFASLLKHQPNMTLEEAGSLIQPGNGATLTQALVKAYIDSNPEPEPESEPKNVQEPEKK